MRSGGYLLSSLQSVKAELDATFVVQPIAVGRAHEERGQPSVLVTLDAADHKALTAELLMACCALTSMYVDTARRRCSRPSHARSRTHARIIQIEHEWRAPDLSEPPASSNSGQVTSWSFHSVIWTRLRD